MIEPARKTIPITGKQIRQPHTATYRCAGNTLLSQVKMNETSYVTSKKDGRQILKKLQLKKTSTPSFLGF